MAAVNTVEGWKVLEILKSMQHLNTWLHAVVSFSKGSILRCAKNKWSAGSYHHWSHDNSLDDVLSRHCLRGQQPRPVHLVVQRIHRWWLTVRESVSIRHHRCENQQLRFVSAKAKSNDCCWKELICEDKTKSRCCERKHPSFRCTSRKWRCGFWVCWIWRSMDWSCEKPACWSAFRREALCTACQSAGERNPPN